MTPWRERLPLIWAIIWKDTVRARTGILATGIAAVAVALLLTPGALSFAAFTAGRFRWDDLLLRIMYAVSAIITSMTLGSVFYTVHSEEVRKGTIRSIVLYPVDANDIAIAKLGATVVVSLPISSFMFLGILAPFFVLGVWPFVDFLALFLTTFAAGFTSLATGVFFAHAVARYLHRTLLSPTGWGALCLILSTLFTEASLTAIGTQILLLEHRGGVTPASFEEFASLRNIALALSTFSPQHWGAHLLSLGFGVFPAGNEFPIAIPAAIAFFAVIGGYLFGRKLYLDLFFQ
ncbi:MAG: hypothetical protein E6K13_01270 [Methanobacteriota archaeon]|nr:MAG: hypothetical protein E6K13_01270 [Euryarchaeota archaeon]